MGMFQAGVQGILSVDGASLIIAEPAPNPAERIAAARREREKAWGRLKMEAGGQAP